MPAYFNRAAPWPLLALLDGPLAWLRAEVAGAWGVQWRAHLQTRANADLPGRLQLYVGSESPLYVDYKKRGFVCGVGKGASRQPPDWFGQLLTAAQLAAREAELRAWLAQATASLNPDFFDNEARVHSGLARRYGQGWQPGDPVMVLDTEATIGFRPGPAGSGTDEKKLMQAALSAQGIPWAKQLDALGLLPDGRLALIEVKAGPEGITAAAGQLACYLELFAAALAAGDLSVSALAAWLAQKQRAGLLPTGPTVSTAALTHVPVIAAPDRPDQWAARWTRALGRWSLPGLQLWRQDGEGRVVERTSVP